MTPRALLFLISMFAGHATAAESKLDNLLVYGKGFMLGVKEPVGWKADTESASRLDANIAFYRPGETPENAAALIRVRVGSKVDEDTAGDLKADMDGYRKENPKVRFEDLVAAHPGFATFPKLFFLDGAFYEYVAYVNPGKGVPFILSVSMNRQRARASDEELGAFRAVVRSLTFFPGVRVKEEGKPKE